MAIVASESSRRKQVQQVFTRLSGAYPHARIVLKNWSTPWELTVSVILSAQCTDSMVNKVTELLFKKYPTLGAYVHADLHAFEQDIRSTGFYHNKAKNILAAAKLIHEKFKGVVPRTMPELLTVPGVARKTANVVLGNAYNVVEGIAVDTHVQRLSQRLRLVDLSSIGGKKIMEFEKDGKLVIDYKKDADPVRIESQLMAILPRNEWFRFTYLMIDHGRAVCKTQRPDCRTCVLSSVCPSSRV